MSELCGHAFSRFGDDAERERLRFHARIRKSLDRLEQLEETLRAAEGFLAGAPEGFTVLVGSSQMSAPDLLLEAQSRLGIVRLALQSIHDLYDVEEVSL